MAVDEEVNGESKNEVIEESSGGIKNAVNEEVNDERKKVVNEEQNGEHKDVVNEEVNGEIKNAVNEEVNDESKKVVNEEANEEPKKVVNEDVNVERKNVVIKKKFFTPIKIVVILVFIFAIVGGGVAYLNQKKASEAEATYKLNLNQVILSASTQGTLIEVDAQAISSVWHDAIFSAPVMVNGKEAYTFDEAIQYKTEELKSTGDIDAIVKGKAEIQKLTETLSNPTSKHKDAYELIMKIFDTYNQFEALVESPSGSLTDYNLKFNTLDSELASELKDYGTRYPVGK